MVHARGVREGVEEAPDQRARVLVVLRRQRPPLRHEAVGRQARAAELVEVARVEVHDAGRRRRRRLERDEVVAVGAPQQLVTAVADPDLEARIGSPRRGCLRRARAARTTPGSSSATTRRSSGGIGEKRPGGDPRAEPDDERRARLAPVDQERQEGLEAHVPPRRERVAGVRDALDVEPSERPADRRLLENRDGAGSVLLVEEHLPAPSLGEQAARACRAGRGPRPRRRPRRPLRRRESGSRASAIALAAGDARSRRPGLPREASSPSDPTSPRVGHEDEPGEHRPGDAAGGVDSATTAPTPRPTARRRRPPRRAAAGKAPPRRIVGARRTTPQPRRGSAPPSRSVSRPVARMAHLPAKTWASGSHEPIDATVRREAAPGARDQEAEQAPRIRGCGPPAREKSQLPIARPPRYVASMMANAWARVLRNWTSSSDQTTS